jgi:hypothetical protein
MKAKLLTPKEREAQGKKLIEFLQQLLGTKNIGLVQKVSIKSEVNELLEVEMRVLL